MSTSKLAILALAAVAVLGALVTLNTRVPPAGLVDAAEFSRLQEQGVRIVDVRTAAEFEAGHIAGAQNVPLSAFAQAFASWDPAQPVALYCASGNRSAEALQMLQAAGFERAYDLAGGIVAWNGPLSGGAEQGVAAASAPQPAGLPVMYEFYTDW